MSTRKILIIEDDPIILYLYKTQFERAGFEVKVANNGEAGFYSLHESRPDAVLLDLMLPKINGIQVLKSIRSSDAFSNIPVFAFTNVYLSDLAKQAKTAGATKVFDKAAIIPLDVIDAVREALSLESLLAASANPQTDSDLNSEVARSFQQMAPKTINALRKTLLALSKSGDDGARVSRLSELYELVHTFAGGASPAGFRVLAEMSAALEALLSELSGRLEQVNVSTLRTVSHAIDFLDVLFTSPKANSELLLVSPLNALIVDDEIISRRAVIASLDRARLKWVESENPYLALSLLKNQLFDLVFLDVSMPEMDGFDVCLELRRLPGHKKTPVIFVTGLTDFESRSRSTLSGGTDLIAKPFLFTELAVKALNHGIKYRLTQSANSSRDLAQGQKTQTQKGIPLTVFGDAKDCPQDESHGFSHANSREIKTEESPSVQEKSSVQAKSLGNPGQVSDEESAVELQLKNCGAGNPSAPLPISVFTLDENGKIQMLNEAAGLMFGYQISDIKDRPLTSLLLQTDEKNISLETLTKFFGGNSPTSKISDRFLGMRRDGSKFLLNLSLSEIVVSGQRMFTGILRDLSTIHSVEKILPCVQPFAGEVRAQTNRLVELPGKNYVSPPDDVSDQGNEPSQIEEPIPCKGARHPGIGEGPAEDSAGREGCLQDQPKFLADTDTELQTEILERQKTEARTKESAAAHPAFSNELVQGRKTEGEFIRPHEYLDPDIQEKSRELSKLQAEIQAEQSRRRAAEARSKEIDAAYRLLTKELMEQRQAEASWRRQCREMETVLEKHVGELRQTREELQKAAADRGEIEARAHTLASTYAGVPQELIQHRKTEERLRSSNQELQDRIETQSGEFTTLRNEFTKTTEKCQKLELKAAEMGAAHNALRNELTLRSQTEHSLRQRNDELQCRLEKQLANLGQVKAELQKQTAADGEVQQAGMNELKLAKESLAHQLVAHQEIERAPRDDHEELKKRVTRQASHLESLQAELERRSSRLDQVESDLRKQVQAREHLESRANELAVAKEALEFQLAEHERVNYTSRQREEGLKTRLAKQHSQLERARGELEKKAVEHQQLVAGAEEDAEKHSALTVELNERRSVERSLRQEFAKLESLVQKQTVELERVQCSLRKETQAHQQSRSYATKLAEAQTILSKEIDERGNTEDTLRSSQNELEQRIGNLTDELLQVQGLRNDDLKQRQQVAAQLQHLLKAEATLTAQLNERTQAEVESRKAYAKLEVFAKAQGSDLGRLRCELESESESRRKAVEEQTALKEAHSGLLQEMATCKQAEQGLRLTHGELQTRNAEQTTALAQIGNVRDHEVSLRKELENSTSNLAAVQKKLESELNERQSELEKLQVAYQRAQAQVAVQTGQVAELHSMLSREIEGHRRTKQQQEELTKAHDSLKTESNKFKRDEEKWKSQQRELKTQRDDHADQIVQIQPDLQKERPIRQQAEAESRDLAEAQLALTRELAEHSKTVTALTEAQAKLFSLRQKCRFED